MNAEMIDRKKREILRIMDRLLNTCKHQLRGKYFDRFLVRFEYLILQIKSYLDIGEYEHIYEMFYWDWSDIFFISTNPYFYSELKKYYSNMSYSSIIDIEQIRKLYNFLHNY